MKIDINKFKTVPKQISNNFELCIYGNPDAETAEWINFHNFKTYDSGSYTNIIIDSPVSLDYYFNRSKTFEYLDGFSPNLKSLHIGHFSNLVLAKAFKSLGINKETVTIFGDTLQGDVEHGDALRKIGSYSMKWDYKPDRIFYASQMEYHGNLLKDGEGDYQGTKIFDIDSEKIVAIKSSGDTTYFYQDVALAETLKASTLYLTGKEQENHFKSLNKLYPHTQHIGLGLVKANGKKMSSRDGNVILLDEIVEIMKGLFNNDMEVSYNVFAGHILKSSPSTDKNIDLDLLNNPKNSAGLYISYTMARLCSAGIELIVTDKPSKHMEFAYLKAKATLSPNILFDCVLDTCKVINSMYNTHTIKDNDDNKSLFQHILSDMLFGTTKLGLFNIKKIE